MLCCNMAWQLFRQGISVFLYGGFPGGNADSPFWLSPAGGQKPGKAAAADRKEMYFFIHYTEKLPDHYYYGYGRNYFAAFRYSKTISFGSI